MTQLCTNFNIKLSHLFWNGGSISQAKEHSTNGGFLCVEKQAIQTSNDISEAHEAFYKAILKKCK